MLYKCCPRCGKPIEYGQQYCSKHLNYNKQRHKEYKRHRTDKEEQSFYNSKEWLKARQCVITKYKGLDLYEYYINNSIVRGEMAHHIEEIKECWNKRLDILNLFLCSKSTHNLIHCAYDKSEESKRNMQLLLKELCKRFIEEFGEN